MTFPSSDLMMIRPPWRTPRSWRRRRTKKKRDKHLWFTITPLVEGEKKKNFYFLFFFLFERLRQWTSCLLSRPNTNISFSFFILIFFFLLGVYDTREEMPWLSMCVDKSEREVKSLGNSTGCMREDEPEKVGGSCFFFVFLYPPHSPSSWMVMRFSLRLVMAVWTTWLPIPRTFYTSWALCRLGPAFCQIIYFIPHRGAKGERWKAEWGETTGHVIENQLFPFFLSIFNLYHLVLQSLKILWVSLSFFFEGDVKFL